MPWPWHTGFQDLLLRLPLTGLTSLTPVPHLYPDGSNSPLLLLGGLPAQVAELAGTESKVVTGLTSAPPALDADRPLVLAPLGRGGLQVCVGGRSGKGQLEVRRRLSREADKV